MFIYLSIIFSSEGMIALAVLVPALLAGKVGGQPSAGWFMVGVFTLVVVGMLLYRVDAAIQHGAVRIRRDSLSFREYGLFGKHHEEWKRDEIEAVRVDAEECRTQEYGTRESVTFDHFIRVEPASDSELEWMVTSIHQHLDLDADER